MIRIAAVGDVHLGPGDRGALAPALEGIGDRADVLLLAGDLSRCGTVDEARVLVDELAEVPVPVVAVLGNHDHHDGAADKVAATLADGGVRVLEGDTAEIPVGGATLGVAGVKGFGGGFWGAHATAFGEDAMKDFVHAAADAADRLAAALARLETTVRVALLHYAPVRATLHGEPPEIYPFLGSHLLAEAVDAAGAELVLHGHAHAGVERGATPGGVPVRNVARPVIGRAYALYQLDC